MEELEKKSNDQPSGDKFAKIAFVLSIVGFITSIFVIGIPISVVAIVLAVKAKKIGNFHEYTTSDDDGGTFTATYKFKANFAFYFSIVGILLPFVAFIASKL